jgi:hypothetical protein
MCHKCVKKKTIGTHKSLDGTPLGVLRTSEGRTSSLQDGAPAEKALEETGTRVVVSAVVYVMGGGCVSELLVN